MVSAASQYRDLLNKESTIMAGQCDKWQTILDDSVRSSSIPDEVCGKIQIAVGQAQLLMSKKFEQFRGLIDACENGCSPKLSQQVTVQDLQGFWDLVYIQVVDINNKFQEICNLEENNWELADTKQPPLGRPMNSIRSPDFSILSSALKKDYSAQAKARLAKAKAIARNRQKEQN